MNKAATLMCPFYIGFECCSAGEALPPDGTPAKRSTATRCPPGYLPHRRQAVIELAGKRVLTDQPAQRKPDASTDMTGEPPDPDAAAR